MSHPKGTNSEELIRINRLVWVIYLFNNPLLTAACSMAGTVGIANMLKLWSPASESLAVWQETQTYTQLYKGEGSGGRGEQ